MGLISDFRNIVAIATKERAGEAVINLPGQPWASQPLAAVVFADITGLRVTAPDRRAALRVPGVSRGRALICSLSRYPLKAYRTDDQPTIGGDGRLVAPPSHPDVAPWLTATSTPQSPRGRALWTYDDLIFSGLSVWAVLRDPDSAAKPGKITDAYRIPRSMWTLDDAGQVLIADQTLSSEQVLLFEGPQEGLVTLAAETIIAARDMAAAWAKRVKSPVPMIELHSTDLSMNMRDDEAKELVAKWEAARQDGGGTAYTPYGIETKMPAPGTTDLFVEGRNALRLDIANFLSLPASLLEGSMSTASLTYSTSEGKRNDLVDLGLNYWSDQFEARLSQDDVVDPGYYVAHDLGDLATPTQPTRSPAQED